MLPNRTSGQRTDRPETSAPDQLATGRAGVADPGRRRLLALLAGSTALAVARPGALRAQADGEAGTPFSFDALIQAMRARAAERWQAPTVAEGFFSGLDYDGYQRIRFDPERARWSEGGRFRVNAFHLGWLFDEPVALHEVTGGQARPMSFSTEDFRYHAPLGVEVPAQQPLPGVAGVRLNAPLNQVDRFDEVVSFLGASYFRALGMGNRYGLSARGVAVNTGLPEGEEFPRFEAFWLERPAEGANTATLCAALSSQSLTGAFRFTVRPGDPTRIGVEAHLFLREDVAQLGIAPLTSMYLYGPQDQGEYDDYRPAVHDSEGLFLASGDQQIWRPLKNPSRLANSYFEAESPRAFGLVQRRRGFDAYLDAEARYDLRPSVMIRPQGEWGRGRLRLVEIPTEREINDNIVAFWVPETGFAAGQEISFAYDMDWGTGPGEATQLRPGDLAAVRRSLAGHGGNAGAEPARDRRKFVVDFDGGMLGELPAGAEVTPIVTASSGEVLETVLSPIEGTRSWRLVTEVEAEGDQVVELMAHLEGYGQRISETWAYQWLGPEND